MDAIHEFQKLAFEEKLIQLARAGSLVYTRYTSTHRHVYYVLENFFVEVEFHDAADPDRPVAIIAFKEGPKVQELLRMLETAP